MVDRDLEKKDDLPVSIQSHLHNQRISTSSNGSTHIEDSTNLINSEKQGWISKILVFVISQWFLISLGLVIVIASQVQVSPSHQHLKSIIVSYLCVSIIFFLTGCTLSTRILIDNFARWKVHLFVQAQVFLVTSSIIFALVSLCAINKNFMDPGLLLGMILSGCTPTTIASNVIMTRQAHGNEALTVVESTLSNFLGPFLTPVLFRMFISGHPWYSDVLPESAGGYGEIYRRVFKQLGLSLFVPMVSHSDNQSPRLEFLAVSMDPDNISQVAGQLVQHLLPAFTKNVIIKYKITKLSPLCLLVIVWQTYDSAFSSHAFDTIKASNMILVVFSGIGLYLVFIAIAVFSSKWWLSKQDTVAVAYISPAKTPAMGVPLAMVMFVGLTPQLQAKLQIPMVIYQGLQIMGGTVCIKPFRTWIDRARMEEAKAETN